MNDKLQPLFLVKPGTIKRADIKRAEKACGIIIAECSDPASVRLMEPPIDAAMDIQARAAMSLFRWITSWESNGTYGTRGDILHFFVKALMEGERIPEPQKVLTVKK